MKYYKMVITSYFRAKDLEEAREIMEKVEPAEWDSYRVDPPIELVDYEPVDSSTED